MIVVHHLDNSRSQRILWLMEELGLDYRIELYHRDSKTMLAPGSLKSVHPLGRSPVITDDELVIAESGAIIEYLIDRYGKGRMRPEDDASALLQYRYWLHYAEGTLMPLLLLKLVIGRFSQPPVPLLLRPAGSLLSGGLNARFIRPRLRENLEFIDRHLADHEWFAGAKLSAADVQMSFPLEAARARNLIKSDFSNIAAFVDKVQARSAYLKALERGGPYAYA